MTSWRILVGDVRERLASLPAESVQCCVTSPPYWGLRDYGHAGQLGLEPTPDAYVANMVQVFREVRRVLREDGTLWLNLGDSYNSSPSNQQSTGVGSDASRAGAFHALGRLKREIPGLKPKDLVGIPWRVAFALQADGWYLRSDIIWHKPNPMPESVTDRPTKAHEYLFMLSKAPRYYYDAMAVAEPLAFGTVDRLKSGPVQAKGVQPKNIVRGDSGPEYTGESGFRNRRSVWTIATQPYPEAHFATYPEALVEPCILAGSREGDTVLDPFCGSGTTGAMAARLLRSFVGCELNPAYVELARKRIGNSNPLFAQEEVA